MISNVSSFLKNYYSENPQLSYLIFSSTLLFFRILLPFVQSTYFSILLIFPITVLLIQIIIISIYKTNPILKKKKCKIFIQLLSLFTHGFLVYLFIRNLEETEQKPQIFFSGIEISMMVYFSFLQIGRMDIRIFIMGATFASYLFLLGKFNMEIEVIFYYVYLAYVFGILIDQEKIKNFDNSRQPTNTEGSTTVKLKLQKMPSLQRRATLQKKETLKKAEFYTRRKSEFEVNPFFNDSSTAFSIMNILNEGIILIDENLNIAFANTCIFELFRTIDVELLKNLLFAMEEDQDYMELYGSEFNNIPDFTLECLIRNNLKRKMTELIVDSSSNKERDNMTSSNNDDDFRRMKSIRKYSQFSSKIISFSTYKTFEELEASFYEWDKFYLNDNVIDFDSIRKRQKPKTILDYLQRLIKYCKKNLGNESRKNSARSLIETEKYSMYTKIQINNDPDSISILSINFLPLKPEEEGNNKAGIVIVIRKLTDNEIKARGNESSKNKILGSFCHELRTPLNSLINMLDLMQMTCEDLYVSVLNDYLASAIISSNLLLNEIDNFIDYFSLNNDMFEINIANFDLYSFFTEIYRVFFYIAAKKNLEFLIEYDKKIPTPIRNDSHKIRQVIFNLLNNAIRFTQKGSVKLMARFIGNEIIRISVIDTGCGIDPDEIQLLGKINQDEGDHRTTGGFGLFVSNHIVNEIEGGFDDDKIGMVVYSEIGKGSCFSFQLKHFPEELNNTSHNNSRIELSSHRTITNQKKIFEDKKRIPKFIVSESGILKRIETSEALDRSFEKCKCKKVLIVDDSPFNLEAAQILLKKNGVESDLANNGVEALNQIKIITESKLRKFCRRCKFYKLILMDIDMPIKNGIQTTKELKEMEQEKKIKMTIVGLSAFHQEDIRKQGMDAGMENYIIKPINQTKIKELIAKFII